MLDKLLTKIPHIFDVFEEWSESEKAFLDWLKENKDVEELVKELTLYEYVDTPQFVLKSVDAIIISILDFFKEREIKSPAKELFSVVRKIILELEYDDTLISFLYIRLEDTLEILDRYKLTKSPFDKEQLKNRGFI